MTFDHVIQNSDGLYYRGSCYGNSNDWTSEVRPGFDGAFTYTEQGALKRLQQFPTMFRGCKVVKR